MCRSFYVITLSVIIIFIAICNAAIVDYKNLNLRIIKKLKGFHNINITDVRV